MSLVKKSIGILVGTVLFASLFYDEIWASFFYHPDLKWALWMQDYGQLPSLLLGLVLLIFQAKKSHSLLSKSGWIFSALILALGLGFHYGAMMGLSRLEGMSLGLGLCLILYYGLGHVEIQRYQSWVNFAAWVFLGAAIFPHIIKVIWARPRYTEVLNGKEVFVSWISLQWGTFEDRLMSFPSGHSAITASLFSLVFIPYQSKIKRNSVLLIILAYTILMMVSRLVLGQHYVSDVLVGVGLVLVWIEMLRHKFQ